MHIEDEPEEAGARRHGYLPSPADIRTACEAFQAGWSPAERERRRVYRPPRYEPPMYNSREIDEALNRDRMTEE